MSFQPFSPMSVVLIENGKRNENKINCIKFVRFDKEMQFLREKNVLYYFSVFSSFLDLDRVIYFIFDSIIGLLDCCSFFFLNYIFVFFSCMNCRCGQETRVIPRILQLRSHWLKSEKESLRLEEAGITKEVNFCLFSFFMSSVKQCFLNYLCSKIGTFSIRLKLVADW